MVIWSIKNRELVLIITVKFLKGRNMELEGMSTIAIIYTRDSLKMELDLGTEGIFGLMGITELDSGKMMRGMDMGRFLTGMELCTVKVSGKMEDTLENEWK